MAQRRMFSLEVVDTDAFLDMPTSTQNLYFHLGMRADDDGFVSSPRKITAMVSCTGDDLKLLIAKGFVIPFDSGVCVIRDWKINNYIRADRYSQTSCHVEKQALGAAENGAYILLDTAGIPDGNRTVGTWDTQVRLGKDRKGKDKESTPPAAPSPTAAKLQKNAHGQYGWVKLTDEQHARLLNDLGQDEAARCIAYVDESAQTTGNKNKWRDWNLTVRRCSRDGWGLRGGQQAVQSPPAARTGRVEIIDGEEVYVCD